MTEDRMLDLISSRAAVEAEVDQYIAFLNGAFAEPADTCGWQGASRARRRGRR